MPVRELPHYWTPEQIRQILAVMPAGKPWLLALLTGRCESWLAHGVRPLRRGNPVSHKPIPTTPIKLEASP